MTFDELSDEMMGLVLDSLPAEEQTKLLLLLRRLVSKTGQAWIDKQLKARKLERCLRAGRRTRDQLETKTRAKRESMSDYPDTY